jgi:glycosyltransferase involved in cell wall biosynthesis
MGLFPVHNATSSPAPARDVERAAVNLFPPPRKLALYTVNATLNSATSTTLLFQVIAVSIAGDRVKKVCYVLGASRDRSPRATKIAQALDAKVIDCPSKVRRYSTFPISLLMRLIFSSYDIVIANNIPTHILFSVWLASRFRRFILIADFVNFWRYAVKKKFRLLSGLASRFERWIYRRIEYGLAINAVVAESARDAGVSKVETVCDAADHGLFRPSFNLDPVVVLAANLRIDEGVDVLLRAMRTVTDKIPTARCILAGTGEEEENLKELAKDLRLESNVDFLGWVPHSDLPLVYQRASIGVVSIRPISPLALPIKLYEYMSCGLAVISTDTSTIRTIIEDGKNGLLFGPEDSDALASLVIRVLLHKDLMANLQKAARYTVEAGLNWRAESEKLIRFVGGISLQERA